MPDNNQLSERELEILKLLATGASNKEIANELVISVNTVKVHLRNIYSKLEVSSRTEASMWAVRAGIVSSEIDEAETAPGDSVGEEPQSWLRRFWWVLVGGILVSFLAMLGVWFARQESSSSISEAPTEQFSEPERWQELAKLSIPRSHFAFAAYDNQLYTIAGKTENGVSNIVERYSPQLDSWATLSSKPIPVADVNAAVIGGKIYVPGGRLESGEVTDVVEVYDPWDDQWTIAASIPDALSAYALATLEGKLYLFGGWDGRNYTDTVYEYIPEQDLWNTLDVMPTPRGFAGATVVGEKIYILGGYDGNQALDVNETFSPGNKNEPWSTGQSLPQGRYGMGVTSLADTIYLLGGEAGQETIPTSFQYRPLMDEWISTTNPFAQTWSQMGIASIATNLYIWGGNLDGIASGQLWYYQAIYTISIPVIQQ